MGTPIPLREVTGSLGAGHFIATTYARLARLPEFVERAGQQQLSEWVREALVSGQPLAAEAPTGTGKTVAYLVGALAAARALGGDTPWPVVVATATKGLQAQVIRTDLPKLFAAEVLQSGEVALAKGRGNYFCILEAERRAEEAGTASADFFDHEHNTRLAANEEARELLQQWYGQAWDGDRDHWTGPPPQHWVPVAASRDTCIGRRCSHFRSCPFFRARGHLATARLVIANHDLVLADLAQHAAGVEPLFPWERYLVVFDEAHHLPDKAIAIGSVTLDVTQVQGPLAALPAFGQSLLRHAPLARLLANRHISLLELRPDMLLYALRDLQAALAELPVDEDQKQYRFRGGVLPPAVQAPLAVVADRVTGLARTMTELMGLLRSTDVSDRYPALRGVLAEAVYQGAGHHQRLQQMTAATTALLAATECVRWVYRSEPTVELHACPLEGADVLRDLLWSSSRVRPVLTSATLQDFASFSRFRVRAGLPEQARTEVLPPIFAYRESEVVLVRMRHSPRQAERAAYREELLAILPQFVDPTEGTLVLFPSWSLLRAAAGALRAVFGAAVLVQGERSLRELRKSHEDRIHSRQGSILCGVATLAEGIDMPGVLCTHVIITAIPFASPTEPVEQELAERLGKRYFPDRALPDALVKLVQMVGRLIRRESDRGRITIFDKRLYETQYGRRMLRALPPFRIRLEQHNGGDRRLQMVAKPALRPATDSG